MATGAQNTPISMPEYDAAVADLVRGKDTWARTTVAQRITILQQIKDALLVVSQAWAETASRKKLIPAGSPLEGEEWTSGPYAVMSACNGLMQTLSQIDGKAFLNGLAKRKTVTGQLAVRVVPSSIWDRLLLSGVRAEVWMQPGVTRDNLAANTASAYDTPPDQRQGKVALVLGAGNIASIAPLDCFQKLFLEHQVVILKLNPVNDYLFNVYSAALAPLIQRDALRIVRGDGAAGAYLTNHPDIEELHITGAEATHDAIVWGVGDAQAANKAAGTPVNPRRITSELGAVCPTIVVPGPWSDADIAFQAQHIATQKMHNSGFNCIACQMLVMPRGWDRGAALLAKVEKVIAKSTRLPYYPGADARMDEFADHADAPVSIHRGKAKPAVLVANPKDAWFENNEVFAPALSVHEIDAPDAETYLRAAIAYANDRLHGTLGGNILIHPKTIRQIGKQRFEELIGSFHYGCVAINAWAGLGFLLIQTPWGPFPGHTLDDVQSGIGTVHNSYMFDRPERSVVQAPWAPFPRSILTGEFTLMPKPPWFITNRSAHKTGQALTRFQHKPGWLGLPRLFASALRG
ncbi:MAG: acyl-CoA reductase-like NAD-dependent aldehyde dehydrogenase [Paracoccaceae bacterium]|jgi:acyl-CoA reductase-like NAD-dependent aldehyde dehydrogenase